MNLCRGYFTLTGFVVILVHGLPGYRLLQIDPKQCGTLGQPPSNGSYNATSGSYGDVARLICDHGYNLQGQGQRTCGADGRWSSILGSCQAKRCGSLGQPPSNGYYNANTTAGSYMYGDVVWMLCIDGYNFQGQGQRACGSDGRWSPLLGSCQAKYCGSPGRFPNYGIIHYPPDQTYGNVYTLICDHGYHPTGPNTKKCLGDGRWTNGFSGCQASPCVPLVNPSHGQYNRISGRYQTQSTLICNKGYQTQTPVTRTCQADGTWSLPIGTCQVKQCAPFVNPPHGHYNPTSGWYQTQSTLICDKGYQTQTPVTRTCQADGTWSLPVGTCQAQSCGSPGTREHGSYSSTTGVYQDIIMLLCDTGYQIQTRINRTCQANGTWSPVTEKCNPRVKCEGPQLVEHGHYSLGLDTTAYYQDRTWFTCIPGYVIYVNGHQKDNYTRMCLSNSTWDGHEPQCLVKHCDPLVNPSHGQYNRTSGWYQTQSTLICDKGYQTQTPVTRTCQADGIWSLPVGTCQAQSCGSPGIREHGSYSSTTGVYQDIIMLLCDTGYQIQTRINRTCQANGTWSPVTEKCNPRVKCEGPQLVEHGHYSLGLDTTAYYQDRTLFTCVPGYVIYINGHQKDNYTRMCLSNSTWDGHEPQCLDASSPLGKDSEKYPWTASLVGVGIGVLLSLLSALIIFASIAHIRRRRKKKSSANELYTIPTAMREETTYYDELGRPDSFNGGSSMEEANQYEINDP